MKKIAKMQPRMVESGVIRSKLRDEEDDMMESMPPEKHQGMSEDKAVPKDEMMDDHFAKGGEIPEEAKTEGISYTDRADKGYGKIIFKAEGGMIDADSHDSIADAIMAKRERMKMMAEGGMVDIEDNGQEDANGMDELNEAALKENYDSDMEDVSQPMDSNEHGHEIDSDKHDMVGKIRNKMIRKRISGMK